MRAAIHDGTTVKNVIMYDRSSGYLPQSGLSLVELPSDSSVSPGWEFSGGKFSPPSTLSSDRSTIPADNATPAVVTYRSGRATQATFSVNGATTSDVLANGSVSIEVVATAPGPIVVTCEGLSITLTATEVAA